jgi:hypothetical protein
MRWQVSGLQYLLSYGKESGTVRIEGPLRPRRDCHLRRIWLSCPRPVSNVHTYMLSQLKGNPVVCAPHFSLLYVQNTVAGWSTKTQYLRFSFSVARWILRPRRCYGHSGVASVACSRLGCGYRWRHLRTSCSFTPKWTDSRLIIRCTTVCSQLCLLQCLHPKVLRQTVVC